MMNRVILFFAVFASFTGLSQAGAIDPTFNTIGIGAFGNGNASNGIIQSAAVQSDGKIIIGGTFTSYHGYPVNRIARLNADGSLDTTFNVGSGLVNLTTATEVLAITIQPDGKILVGGRFNWYNNTTSNGLVRIHSDGAIDTDFQVGSGVSSATIRTITLQEDGKILVGGTFTNYNGTTVNRMIRLHGDASLDTDFDIGSGFNGDVRKIVVQADGKIIVGGSFNFFNGTTRNRIVRLNLDGSFDTSFNIGNGFGIDGGVNDLVIQSDGKILAAGSFFEYGGFTRMRIARINTNGTLDTSFNPGNGFNSVVYSIQLQDNGKIVVGGQFSSYNGTSRNRIVRLNNDASIDESFDIGSGFNNNVNVLRILSNGKILAGGEFTSFSSTSVNRIGILNSNGAFDFSFNPITGFNAAVRTIAVQTDGKILVGGEFTTCNGIARNRIARINADGTLDTTFDPGSGFNNNVHTIAIQPNGKILVGGLFTSFNGVSINRFIRLNIDGSNDPTLDIGLGFNGVSPYVTKIVALSDGKILVGGTFNSYNGTSRNRIARLNADGSNDPTFTIGTGFGGEVWSIESQPDGKIIVGGSFSTFNSESRVRIARLNSDGTLDTSFDPGIGFNGLVYSTATQTDGKIIVGGGFFTYQEVSRGRICRLNENGSLDTSFDPGTGFSNNSSIWSVSLQTNGKIVAGGTSLMFNGTTINRITRLNTNGSLDENFETGAGFNDVVRSIVIQLDGHILVGGFFTVFNGNPRSRITRIIGDNPCLPTSSNINVSIAQGQSYLFNNQNLTVAGTYNMTLQNAAGCDSVVTLNLMVVEPLNYALNATNNEICVGDEVVLSVNIPAYPAGYVHCNPSIPTAIANVTNPTTVKAWMDRNLGADRVAESSSDTQAYGSLFQWGRFGDGHQCVYRYVGNNFNTSLTSVTLSSVDQPPHGNFILVGTFPNNWRSPQNTDLWQGVNGVNNPCPSGYRVPTETELIEEKESWDNENAAGAFASPLKLPLAGYRSRSNGSLFSSGTQSFYWSSTVSGNYSRYLTFNSNSADTNAEARAQGNTVRCIKN